ncbi:ABC transporter ATP-binding protein [Promicromonospora sp. Populi]|uniref:ABC transporter ATP-binding protein n=1 Tax=Promicromonospora sp. Populi TaxID=3239420 RepID=UPI0034E27DB1
MTRAFLQAQRISRTFPGPPEVEALRRASLAMDLGERVTILGKSGSGKSTLMNILGLLDAPDGGKYHLGGVDTSTLSNRGLDGVRARDLGFVFQAFHVLGHKSVYENVNLKLATVGTPRAVRREVIEAALSQVSLAHRISSPARLLSGGEKQRLAIARAIVGRPRVIFADEPTGNLDPETAAEVRTLLSTLAETGIAVLVISHDPDMAAWADRRLTLIDGVLE